MRFAIMFLHVSKNIIAKCSLQYLDPRPPVEPTDGISFNLEPAALYKHLLARSYILFKLKSTPQTLRTHTDTLCECNSLYIYRNEKRVLLL